MKTRQKLTLVSATLCGFQILLNAAKWDRMDSVSLIRNHAITETCIHFLMNFILVRLSTNSLQEVLIKLPFHPTLTQWISVSWFSCNLWRRWKLISFLQIHLLMYSDRRSFKARTSNNHIGADWDCNQFSTIFICFVVVI